MDLKPNGTEGYRTAEVTLGGVDCDAISSKTMEATILRGFILSVKYWMLGAGWADSISNGLGLRVGPQGKWFEEKNLALANCLDKFLSYR